MRGNAYDGKDARSHRTRHLVVYYYIYISMQSKIDKAKLVHVMQRLSTSRIQWTFNKNTTQVLYGSIGIVACNATHTLHVRKTRRTSERLRTKRNVLRACPLGFRCPAHMYTWVLGNCCEHALLDSNYACGSHRSHSGGEGQSGSRVCEGAVGWQSKRVRLQFTSRFSSPQ